MKLAIASLLILNFLAVFMTAISLFIPVEYMDIPLPEEFSSKAGVQSLDAVWLSGIAMGRSKMLPSVVIVCSALVLHFAALVVLGRKLGKKS